MKILFLDQFTENGGAQLILRDVLRETRQRGWEPWLMAPGSGPLVRFCEEDRIPFRSIRAARYSNGHKTGVDVLRYGFDSVRAAFEVRRLAEDQRFDLVYVNGPRMLPAGVAAGRPVLFHAHSYLDKKYARWIAEQCLRRGKTTVVAVSEFVAKAFAVKPRVVYNGVEDCGFLPSPRGKAPPVIGMIGRIAPEKGVLDFIRAAKALARSGDMRFVVFGEGLFSNPAYGAEVRRSAEGTAVEFRGWTDDISSALHEIDILAVPSQAVEACPRIILEAFSAGTPVVAYPSGGIPELIRHTGTGMLTASANAEALVSAIQELAADPDRMARCSTGARREWEARFSAAKFRKDVGDLIAGCCA